MGSSSQRPETVTRNADHNAPFSLTDAVSGSADMDSPGNRMSGTSDGGTAPDSGHVQLPRVRLFSAATLCCRLLM